MKKIETYKAEREALLIRQKHLASRIRKCVEESTILDFWVLRPWSQETYSDKSEEEQLKQISTLMDEFNANEKALASISNDLSAIEAVLAESGDTATTVRYLRDMCGYNLREIADRLGYSHGYIRCLMAKHDRRHNS